VIKENVPVVTGATGAALTIIRDAAAHKADLYVLGEAFAFAKKGEQTMSYRGVDTSFDSLSISLRGDHQLFNASLAVCTLELLAARGFAIDERIIRQGLSTTVWPGRLELIPEAPGKPAVLLDGAHNPDGARTLAAFLRSHFQDRKKVLLFGVMKDKDFREMLLELLPVVQRVILTKPETARAALPADVAAYAPGARVTDSVRDGIGEAFKAAGEKDLVVIAGSFYTLGEAKRLLDEPA
jgi:dihydrofolate synthase/folylpolyglutamate synthase